MKRFIVVTICAALFPTAAFAYVDPGMGSYAIQGLLAVIAGVTLSLKSMRLWISAQWAKFSAGSKKPAQPEKSGPDLDAQDLDHD